MVVAGGGAEGEGVGVVDDDDVAGGRRCVGGGAEGLEPFQDVVERDELFARGEMRKGRAQPR